MTTHLWQSTFFAMAAGLLTLAFRRNRAQVRYWLWLSASLKFFAPFAFLTGLGSYLKIWGPAATIAAKITTPAVSYVIDQFGGPSFSEATPAELPTPTTVHWIPVALFTLWLCGFVTIAVIRFRSWLRIRAAVRRSIAVDIPEAVEIRLSPAMLEPGVVGLLRPVLLLPEGITERLTPSELKAVIAHEMCHVQRRDNLFAAIHMIVEAAFWFHPFVWWIGARLVEERERACDEEVLSLGNQPDVYADAILNVCKLYVESPLVCVSGVSGASIRRRIEAIMAHRRLKALSRTKTILLTAVGIIVLAGPVSIGLLVGIGDVPMLRAQSLIPQILQTAPAEIVHIAQAPPTRAAAPTPAPAARPKFDAASIRPCSPGDGTPIVPGGRGGVALGTAQVSPGRLNISCMNVAFLIEVAYVHDGDNPLLNNSGDNQPIRGGPAWTRSERYTIEAETDDPAANGPTTQTKTPTARRLMMGPMLQALLEDRFGLKTHRETEDVPMYALTVAKGGLKLKPLDDGGCIQLDPTQEHHASDFSGPKPVCNISISDKNGPNKTSQVTGSLKWFAQSLSTALGRMVVDKTGITGIFSLHLEYAPDESTPGRGRPNGGAAPEPEPSDVPPGATIFTALEQQLGLKLVADEGPRDYIMIDHVERPSEN